MKYDLEKVRHDLISNRHSLSDLDKNKFFVLKIAMDSIAKELFESTRSDTDAKERLFL
jgi:hypothetical protein